MYRHGALYEMRRLIGMAAGVQAVGSLVAVSSRQSFGLLSMFGLLTGSTEFDTEQVLDCLNGSSHANCFAQYRMMRFTMPGNWLVSLMPTLMLLLIAWGLYRGRRIAAVLSVLFNACTVYLRCCFMWCFRCNMLAIRRLTRCLRWLVTVLFTRCFPLCIAVDFYRYRHCVPSVFYDSH